jgi:hypothetical protein
MSEAMIGALRAVLGIDTVAFSKGLKDAEKSLNGFGTSFSSVAKRLAIPAAAIAGLTALAAGINKAIDAADNMGKASQKFGVPIEQLSALKFAADLADVSFESLGKGLGKLSKAILESAANPAGEAAKNFKALGVSVKDSSGNIKSTESIFSDIAAKFATMEDGAAKTALAIRLFGRAGADLIPLLNQGRTGIKLLTDEAKRLGIIITGETAAKAEEFNDTLKRIHTTQDALLLRMAEAFLPALQSLANAFLQAAQEGSGFKDSLKTINARIITDIEDVQKISLAIENLARIFTAFTNLPSDIASKGWTVALENLDKVVEENRKRVDALKRSFLSLGEAGAFESMENLLVLLDKVARGFGKIDEGALKSKDAIQSFIEGLQKSQALQAIDIATTNAAIGVKERLYIIEQARHEAIKAGRDLSAQEKADIDALAASAANLAVQFAKIRLEKENLTAEEKYMEKLKEIDQLEQGNARQREIAHRARIKAETEYTTIIGESLAKSAGQFADFFNAFAGSSKEMFLIGKALAISQATIQAYLAFTNALANTLLPPPFPQIAAAAALAAGLGAVAKIVAQKQPTKAALGGSFRVPGGASGVDTKLVRMQLAPGERVDVTPASSAGGDRTLIIPAINAKDFFTGEVVREMVLSIDQWIRDGGTGIKFAGAGR